METNRNSQLPFTEGSGKPIQLVSPIHLAEATEDDEAKWNIAELVNIVRRRGLLVAGVTIGTIVAGGSLFAIKESTTPPLYYGQFQLLVEPVTAEDKQAKLSTQAQSSDRTSGIQQIDVQQSTLDYDSQIEVLKSPRLMDPLIKQLQARYPYITYDMLKERLQITRVRSSDRKQELTKLIQVSYYSSDAEEAQFVLNEVSKAYLRYSLKERQSNLRQGIQFIEGRLPELRQRVDSLQRQVQDLRQRYNLVDPDLQGQQLTSRASTLDQQRADSQTQLAETRSRYSTLKQQLQGSNIPSVLGEAPYYQNLLNQYQQLEGQIAVESARMQPDNPAMQALLEKRQNLQALLRLEADRVLSKAADQITIAQTRNQAIISSENEVTQRLKQLPSIARQYTDMQRELGIATESLNKFLSRREALQIDVAQQEVPWEVMSPPDLLRDRKGQPLDQHNSNLLNFLILSVILGILLGAGTALLVEAAQDVLQTPEDTKRAAKLPLLGAIPVRGTAPSTPFLGGLPFRRRPGKSSPSATPEGINPEFSSGGQIPQYSASSFTEAFRLLYKNIRLLKSLSAPVRSLTISSAEAGDGKSTIAVNLAQAAAAMGQRVLLVDADLRHPQIHHLLNLPNQHGLNELITNHVTVQEAIQQVPNRPNLMVLAAGQASIDPVEILTSPRMLALMDRFLVAFDLVIYDTPPLVGLADSSLVAAHTHGLALVMRLGKTRRSLLTKALDELKLSSTTVLGLVANCAKETVVSPYGYAYRRYDQRPSTEAPVQIEL